MMFYKRYSKEASPVQGSHRDIPQEGVCYRMVGEVKCLSRKIGVEAEGRTVQKEGIL